MVFYLDISRDFVIDNVMNIASFLISKFICRIQHFLPTRDVLAMAYLSPFYKTYLPWSAASMQASSIRIVINDILINHRKFVVECGSGVSTYFIAKVLRSYGGHLITIDHDLDWLETLKQILSQEGLNDQVTFVHAPLVPSNLAIGECKWYDACILDRIMECGSRIDYLLVDGPPAIMRNLKYSRYPAVPYFKQYLADDYVIALHDIDRLPERRIIEMWGKLLDIRFELRTCDGKLAVSRSPQSFAV